MIFMSFGDESARIPAARRDSFGAGHSMEITDLRYFHHVAVTRSFARAAELACISQSAVSKAVRRLEEELQTPLFERTTRRVVVTEAGRILHRHCEALFEDLESLRREIESVTDTATGVLWIGAMEVFSIFALPNAVIALLARHPGMQVRCVTMTPDEMQDELLHGRIDVGLIVGDAPNAQLRYHALGSTGASLVCNPQSPLAQSPVPDAATRAETAFVSLAYFRSGAHPMGPTCVIPDYGRPGPTVDSLSAATQFILDGPFAGYLPELAIHCQLNHGELIRVPTAGPQRELRLGALTAQSPPRLATVTLLECLQTIIAEAAIRSCGRR